MSMMKIMKYMGIISLLIVGFFFSVSCNRATKQKASGKNPATISIGILPKDYSDCSIDSIEVSVDGEESNFSSNESLSNKVYLAGQTASIKKVTATCTGNKDHTTLYTEANHSTCPYKTLVLVAGINHVKLPLCVKKASGDDQTPEKPPVTQTDPPEQKPETDPDPEKPKDKTDVEVVITIEDPKVKMPKNIDIQINPTLND